MGSFDGLQTSLSSLYAQRRGMDVTGQNIANANTEGYTRQRVVMKSVGGNTVPAIFSTWNGSSGGVEVADVTRMRDTFLEVRGRGAHASLQQLGTGKEALAQLENVMAEPSDTGMASSLADLWGAFDDLANNPGELAARSALLERASSVADWLHSASSAISAQWSNARTQVDAVLAEVNNAASGVAELNDAIKRATVSGLPSNELADQRDLLAMKLAELTGATTRAGADGTVDVVLGGTALVRGNVTEKLVSTTQPLDLTGVSATNQVGIRWADDGAPASGLGGKTAGYLEVLNTTLPSWSARLDTVATNTGALINTQLAAGRDLDGAAGTALFSGTTAATFSVAITDGRKIAAAGPPPAGALDGGNADKLAALATSASGPDAQFRQLVVDLGVQAQSVNRRVDVQSSVTDDLDDARDAQAGVNIDEEMVNMLTFQRAYEGASRVLTAVDQMLDTLINRTGMAGR
jgi:flagellar hook-associated protein 1 FlgK